MEFCKASMSVPPRSLFSEGLRAMLRMRSRRRVRSMESYFPALVPEVSAFARTPLRTMVSWSFV